MAKGAVTDEFVVISQVRTGLKRELQFVLKSHSEICGSESLGRTRARKNLNGDSGVTEKKTPNGVSDLKYVRKKRRVGNVGKGHGLDKAEGAGGALDEDEAKSDVVDVDESKGVSVESVSKRLYGDNVEEATLMDSSEPMCEDDKQEENKVKEEDNVLKSGRFEDEGGHGNTVIDEGESSASFETGRHEKGSGESEEEKEGEKECLSANGKDDVVDREANVSKLPSEPISSSCFVTCAKLQNGFVDDKRPGRFTPTMLKPQVEGNTCEAKADTELRNLGKVTNIGEDKCSVTSSSIGDWKKKTDLTNLNSGESCLANSSGSSQVDFSAPLIDKKQENHAVDKPLRRFTRSLVKQEADPNTPNVKDITEPANLCEVKEDPDEVHMGDARSPLVASTPRRGRPKKHQRTFPARLKDLLDTGILEGLTVYYLRGAKIREAGTTGLRGVIKGSGVLCFCNECKGNQVVSPSVYESHACSPNKRPPEYILLESGSTLRDVMNVCRDSSLATLVEKLRMVVGPAMKKASQCLNCQGPMIESCGTKLSILCISCLEKEEQEKASQISLPKVPNKVERTPEPRVAPETVPSESKPNPPKSNGRGRPPRKDLRSSEPRVAPETMPSETKSGSLKSNSSKGRLTRKDLRLHKLVFEDDILPDGAEVGYFVAGKKMLVGYKKDFGIHCSCCNTVVSPSQFEAHAGCASRRKPFQHIYTTNGVSLHELSVALSRDQKFSVQENDDLCSICKDGGDLLCCDTCPRSYHTVCASLPSLPSGKWSCKYCVNMLLREKFVECNANALAAGRVMGVDAIAQITKRCIRIVSSLGSVLPSVCVLCRGHSFSRMGFNPRTVIICDQCEKEFHVGCLKDRKIADLKELPEGQWFCGSDCENIHSTLQNMVIRGEEKLDNTLMNFLKKKQKAKEEDCSDNNTDPDVRWRVLSGNLASSSDDTKALLAKAIAIFHERFDPISETGSRGDLIPTMVYGKQTKGQDFGGMYCTMLTLNDEITSVGIFRIFGSQLAELPLVATSSHCQGQGYFQCLFACIERLLGTLNIKNIVLPAADEAKSIWTDKFGFVKMTEEEVKEFRQDFQVMVFEGTSMLKKPVGAETETHPTITINP